MQVFVGNDRYGPEGLMVALINFTERISIKLFAERIVAALPLLSMYRLKAGKVRQPGTP